MKTLWVVVADEAMARILRWPETGDELEPVEELTDPAAHARGTDLRRDAVGRRAASAPLGAGPAAPHRPRRAAGATASAGEGEQHLEADGFARQVAQRLHEALQQGRYGELRVSAAPRFLGLLRKAWSPQVEATVSRQIDKDLIHLSTRDLTQRLMTDRDDGADRAGRA